MNNGKVAAVQRGEEADSVCWLRYREKGEVIDQELVMVWLDALAAGRRMLIPESINTTGC